jgi:hypothetical protein
MKKLTAVLALAALGLSGCATMYQSHGFTGGYSDTQLAADEFVVNFSGNGFTSSERASDFALLRAADLTEKAGYWYFTIAQAQDDGTYSTVVMPGYSQTTVHGYGHGGSFHAVASTWGTGPIAIPVFKPHSKLLIHCYHDKPPGVQAFEAMFIETSIRNKYGIKG